VRDEHVLAVGIYASTQEALEDLRDLTAPGRPPGAVGGAGILRRRLDGATLQQAGGGTLGYGIGTGAAAGIVGGVLVGFPLAGAGMGALVGGVVGHRMRQREIGTLVGVLDDYIPVGSSALVAVVRADSWPGIRSSLRRALRVTGWPVDDGPLLPFARALVRGNPTVTEDLQPPADRDPPADPSGAT
jgi:hypothetical protein